MEQFWNKWEKSAKIVYLLCLLILASISTVSVYFFFNGHNNIIHWDLIDQFENIKVVIDSIKSGIFNIPIEADAKIVFSLMVGTFPELNIGIVWGFFIVFNIALIIALTSFTYLNNWLYYAGTFVIILCYILQQPEILFPFSSLRKLFLVAPVLFIGSISYYFFAFSKKYGFLLRFSAIAAVCLLYLGGIIFLTEEKNPVLYLTNYGTIATVVVAIAFIFLVSFDIVYLFLFLISNNKGAGNKNGTIQFVFIYVLYTANLILQYLKNRGAIQFDLVFINPYFILLTSTILGIWGFKARSEMFKNTLPFSPIGGIIYLSWAILAASSIGYAFYSGNDPIIEVFEDTILFTHIGFGFGFFLYVAWNYSEWINKQIEVHKLIFSYRWVTFLTVYAIGIIIVLCFFFYSNMFIYRQFQSGYHNYLGDVYYHNSDYELAEQYFKSAENWEFQNHKTNYTLATIYQRKNDVGQALNFYRRANLKQPSAFAFANEAVMKYLQGRQLESITDLKEGINAFPNEGALKINLGIFFERINFPDSSFHYLKLAEQDVNVKSSALANTKALLAKYSIKSKETETLIELRNKSNQLITNELAYAFILNQTIEDINLKDLVTDTIIKDQQNALINNFILKTKAQVKDTLSLQTLSKMIASDSNVAYKTDLLFLKAICDNYRNQPFEAAKAIDLLHLSSEYNAGKYLNTLGLWALSQNNSRFAATIFQKAYEKGYGYALVYRAISQAKYQDFNGMVATLQNITLENDSNFNLIKDKLTSLTKPLKYNDLVISEDEAKTTFLIYKFNLLSRDEQQNLFYSIRDTDLKLTAGLALLEHYLLVKDIEICEQMLTALTKETYTSQQLSQLNLKVLQYLALTNNLSELKKAVETNKLTQKEIIYLPYFQAIVSEMQKDTITAEKNYTLAVTNCAFNEEVVIRSAKFFSTVINDHKMAFNVLLNGVAMNPYSISLWKAYSLESIAYGLPKFGENGLEALKPLVTEKEFSDFKSEFEKARDDYSKSLFGF